MGKEYSFLIVDDIKENRLLLRKMLESREYTVQEAENGAEALETARINIPDFIISDVLMPVMDGFQLCIEVKKDIRLKKVPFVFYSATYSDRKDIEFALSLGAAEYIIKPIEPDKFLTIIEHIRENLKKGSFITKTKAIGKEKDVFKLYSERLVNKLEKKMLDLEKEIDERRKTEEQLKKLSSAVNQRPASIMITNREGNIEYVNPNFYILTGYKEEEIMGRNPRILQSGNTTPETYEELWKLLTEGKEWHGEFQNKKKNGELYWEKASIAPIFNDAKEITHFVAVEEDITERKISEEEISKYQNSLEDLVKERTAELEKKNTELEKFNNLFVNREFRIKELKDRIKELEGGNS